MKYVTKPGMSRNIVRLFAILSLAVLLTACGKQDSEKKADSTRKVTEKPTEASTVTPTEAPTSEPTSAPTAEPTTEPTKAPTPVLSQEPVDYGNLLDCFEKDASEIIRGYNREYRYEYWGPDHESEACGGFTFDGMVYFAFEETGTTLNTAHWPDILAVYNNEAKTLSAEIGEDINMSMTYSELKRVMGDVLNGPVSDDDGKQYHAFGYYHHNHYYFTWQQSPLKNDVPADSVVIYKYYPPTHADIATYVMKQPVADYLEANVTLFREHSEQYRGELRSIYKDEPVHKLNLLTTIKADEHNTIEVYESAAFGCPPRYKKGETEYGGFCYEFNGVDKTKELYEYIIVLRLLTDGEHITLYRCPLDDSYYYDFQNDSIANSVTWTKEYESEANALREIIGIVGVQSDLAVTVASTRRPVSEPYSNWSENIKSTYLNDGRTPILIETYGLYEANDGGYYSESLRTADGMNVREGLELKKEGKTRMGGYDMTWRYYESPSGVQMIRTETYEENGCNYKDYYIADGCLILIYERFEL